MDQQHQALISEQNDEKNQAIVSTLMTILAGQVEIPRGVDLIAQDVVSHMDHKYTFHGINTWAGWISFIRSRKRVADLDLVIDRITINPDKTITVYGNWHGTWRGKRVISPEATATYRLQDGKVVEIWTKRTNYTFIFGPVVGTQFGLLLVLFQVMLWNRRRDQLDLRTDPLLNLLEPQQERCTAQRL